MTKLENILHTHDDSDKMTNDRIDKLIDEISELKEDMSAMAILLDMEV